MSRFAMYLLCILGLIVSISPCKAEFYLINDTLTVDIHDTPMKNVLDAIRDQGHFNIVALEETLINNVRISKKFWNLPIEDGLARLLSGWNYGINRDVMTGKISTLYLVSRRSDSSSVPGSPSTPTHQVLRGDGYESQTSASTLRETHDDPVSYEHDEEEDFTAYSNGSREGEL